MTLAVAALVLILAFGWWLSRRKAAAARVRAAEEAYEVHGQERAHELAQFQSELSRVKGWTPTGS